MRERGETRRRSAWVRARRLGRGAPQTTIDPILRALCLSGEKAISVHVLEEGRALAFFGSPLEPEEYVVWRTDAVSVFLHGEVPRAVDLRLGGPGEVIAEVVSSDDQGA